MSRTSRDQFDKTGQLINGFDYDLQVWVKDGICINVGIGKEHAGRRIEEARKKEGLEEVSGVYQLMKEEGAL